MTTAMDYIREKGFNGVKEYLTDIAAKTVSDERDDQIMAAILTIGIGVPSKVTCGMVYLGGYGQPYDIHRIAKEILAREVKP